MALTEAEQAAIGRDLLVAQRLADALARRLRVLQQRVARDSSEAAFLILRHTHEQRTQVRVLGLALEFHIEDVVQTAEWLADNSCGWDQDAEDAAERDEETEKVSI